MLVVSRKIDQTIRVDGPCEIMVVGIRGENIRLGITAAHGVKILRSELVNQPPKESEVRA